MIFLPTLTAWQWALLAAVPIGIVLLYFLKLRRHPLRVPSTFLWRRTVEDTQVNSLLQRLRRNLLLFLQLLFVALVALALLRPGWLGDERGGRRLIFLLDASASMAATDAADAETRFEEAKQRIADQIDAMQADDMATLIAFSDRPNILQEFTSDRRRLHAALRDAAVTSRPTNIRDALQGAIGLANPEPRSPTGQAAIAGPATEVSADAAEAVPAELWIYSDGGFGPLQGVNLGELPTQYVSIGSEQAQNLAIVAFSAERNLENPEQVQAFARVANFGNRALEGTASLTIDGTLVDAAAVAVQPSEESGLSFELDSVTMPQLKLSLEIEDDLAADNIAYAALAPLRSVTALLVTPGNRALQLALETEQATELGQVETKPPSYLDSDEYRARALQGRDDLIIYDRCAPVEMPSASTFFIGALPPSDWNAGETTGPLLPIDIDRTHPIMQFLDLFSLKIVEGRPLQPPRHATILMTTDAGPVLALAPRAGYQDLVMGFDVLSQTEQGMAFNTDWPVQRSWPVFVYNALRHLGGAVEASGAPSYQPGEVVMLPVDPQFAEVRLETPAGATQRVVQKAGGQFMFADTDTAGIYEITAPEGERPLSLFTVNLFDRRESDLRPADKIEVGSAAIAESDVRIAGRSELWRWLLVAALGMLAVEWLVFNRRLG